MALHGAQKTYRMMPIPYRQINVTITSIRLDAMPVLDGWTDGRTDGTGNTISRSACIERRRAILMQYSKKTPSGRAEFEAMPPSTVTLFLVINI